MMSFLNIKLGFAGSQDSRFLNIYFSTGKFSDADSTVQIDRDIKFCLASDSKTKLLNFLSSITVGRQDRTFFLNTN